MEYNLVEMWLRKDPLRWISGALAGLLAAAIAMGVAMLIAQAGGHELWFPVKLMGSILLGSSATDIDSSAGIMAGGLFIEGLGALLGFIYSHFTGSNKMGALLPMGLVWGIFSWIFIWNLFMQSFLPIYSARISSGPVFLICIAFGLSLASVAFFDRALKGKASA